jgi:hypothetical protein
LDIVIAKKICDRSFVFWVEHPRPGTVFGEPGPVLVCNPVAMPVRNGGLLDVLFGKQICAMSKLSVFSNYHGMAPRQR